VPVVLATSSFAGGAEGLAGAGACPNRSRIGPSGDAQGEAKPSDAGEEVALGIAPQIFGPNIDDASLVDVADGNVSSGDEVAEPLCGIGVNLVVISGHDFGSTGLHSHSQAQRNDQQPCGVCSKASAMHHPRRQ
jgi:hypothetical protein